MLTTRISLSSGDLFCCWTAGCLEKRVEGVHETASEGLLRCPGTHIADSDVDGHVPEIARKCLPYLWEEIGDGMEARRGEGGGAYLSHGTRHLLQPSQVAVNSAIRSG